MLAAVLFGLFLVVLLLGVPIGFSMGFLTIAAFEVGNGPLITLAQKMYESYGDTLVENLSDALQEQLAGPLGETIQEQLIEPAKETVMETAKAIAANTAQHFWQDLKQSVIDFLNHVFQKGEN